MLDKKKLPLWLRTTPGRERGLMYLLLQEYEQWCTIEMAAVMLNITNYLCYDFTKKLFECGLLDIGPEGYKLKAEYIKEDEIMETIKQAQNRLESSIDGKNGFYRGVLWANRWIDFQEEKPTEQGFYLVKSKNGLPKNREVVVAEFYEDTFYSESTLLPIPDVAYWRPIERS